MDACLALCYLVTGEVTAVPPSVFACTLRRAAALASDIVVGVEEVEAVGLARGRASAVF